MNNNLQEAQMHDMCNTNQDRWNKARLLKVESELLYATERILPLVVNQAMAGDVKAQKLILDRTIPPLKAVTPPLPQGLPLEDLSTMLQALVVAIAKGEASPTVALDFLSMVKQAAEMREGATQGERANRTELARTKASIARLEMDIASPKGNTYLKALWKKSLVEQQKQLEEMNKVLEAGALTL